MRLCFLLFTALFIASPLVGQGWDREPSSLFGIPFGAMPSQVPKELRTAPCSPTYCHIKVPMHGTLKVFDVGYELTGTLFFTDRGFQAAEFDVPSYEFEFVKNALQLRYGPPTKSETPVTTTALGVEMRSELISWDGEERYIHLTRGRAVGSNGGNRLPDAKLIFGSRSIDLLDEQKLLAATKEAAAKF